jgi:hypothetical protein
MPEFKPPRPDRRAAIEVNAARGPHTPPPPAREERPQVSNPPPPPAKARPKLDSREVTQETLLQEYKGEAEARRAAEARAQAAEARAAAAEQGVTANGPKVSLGSAKWWAVIIGAIAIAAPQVKELVRPSASAVQIVAVSEKVDAIGKRLDARDALLVTEGKADARRWTISAAFLCSQGFRARGLDCAAAQSYADIQPVPLMPKGKPEWKATAQWPTVPIPAE